jgi:hypothetical protein
MISERMWMIVFGFCDRVIVTAVLLGSSICLGWLPFVNCFVECR